MGLLAPGVDSGQDEALDVARVDDVAVFGRGRAGHEAPHHLRAGGVHDDVRAFQGGLEAGRLQVGGAEC